MMTYANAPKLECEEYRSLVLDSLDLLDTANEAEFDSLVNMVSAHFAMPICLISLVDTDRQWFKAKCGLSADETSRSISFCGHTIEHDEVMVVRDARKDLRFQNNPLVASAPHIRFYAGVPLNIYDARIGTLCLIDTDPNHRFDDWNVARLSTFGKLAEDLILTRARRRRGD